MFALNFEFPSRETTQNNALVINSPWHFKSWTPDVYPHFCLPVLLSGDVMILNFEIRTLFRSNYIWMKNIKYY